MHLSVRASEGTNKEIEAATATGATHVGISWHKDDQLLVVEPLKAGKAGEALHTEGAKREKTVPIADLEDEKAMLAHCPIAD